MINIKLSVSILSIKDNIKQNIEKLIKNNINYIHLDIMDGEFVSNKTWNIDEAINILPKSKLNLDVHFQKIHHFLIIWEHLNLSFFC